MCIRDSRNCRVAAHENANTVAEAEMKTKIWSVCVIVMALASGAWGHTGKPAQAADFGPNQWITSVAFSGDGRSIFATSFTKPGTFTVTVWDIAKGKSRRALAAPTRSVDNNATLSPDGRTLAATNNAVYFSDDFTIFLWSVTTGRKLQDVYKRQLFGFLISALKNRSARSAVFQKETHLTIAMRLSLIHI